jgi:hypothetical protein
MQDINLSLPTINLTNSTQPPEPPHHESPNQLGQILQVGDFKAQETGNVKFRKYVRDTCVLAVSCNVLLVMWELNIESSGLCWWCHTLFGIVLHSKFANYLLHMVGSPFTVAGMSTSSSTHHNHNSNLNTWGSSSTAGSLTTPFTDTISQPRSHYQPGYLLVSFI